MARAPDDPLEQTAWERGKENLRMAASLHPALFALLWAVVPAGLVAAAVATAQDVALPGLVGLAVLAAALGWCLVPVAWVAVVAVRAPVAQRNEARVTLQRERERHEEYTDQLRDNQRQQRLQMALSFCNKLDPEIPELLDNLPSDSTANSLVRREAYQSLVNWTRDVCRALKDAGHDDLARDFQIRNPHETPSANELQSLYRKRRELLTSWWKLKAKPIQSPWKQHRRA